MSDWWAADPVAQSASAGNWWSADPVAKSSAIGDIGKSAGVGVAKGVIGLAGLPADAAKLIGSVSDKATDYLAGKLGNGQAISPDDSIGQRLLKAHNLGQLMTGNPDQQPLVGDLPIGSAGIQKGVESVTGPFYKPQSTGGQYAQTAGEFAPAALSGPGGILRRLITQAAIPAVTSETAGQVTKGTAAEPYARVAGGILGGGLARPITSAAETIAAPLISNIQARTNPAGFAASQVARAMQESGQTPGQLAGAVGQAATEGQPQFALADALGNPGQRMLSSVTRAPGEGRTAAVDFLDARQAGQGRRVANTLAEGFNAPETAAQTQTRLEAARSAAADAAYGQVRQDANPVDVTGVINRIDQTVRPGVNQFANPGAGMAPDSVEAALSNVRNRLTDGRSQLTDFESLQRVRGDLADQIAAAQRAGAGNKVRLLTQVRQQIDQAMEAASPGFRAANADFSARSAAIDAIEQGRQAATRGRVENTVPAFRAMPPDQQQAFRSGYVDPLIEQTQGAAAGANKARPFSSDAFRQESAAMAPGNAQLTRRLGREQTMFETRQQATGGSKTADNLADAQALGVDPSVVRDVVTGNVHGLMRSALTAGANALTGNTAAVRQEVGRLLTLRGGNVSQNDLQDILSQALNRVRARQVPGLLGTINNSRGLLPSLSAAQGTQQRQ